MSLILPGAFRHKNIRHMSHNFATGAAATTLVTAAGTGLRIIPLYMAWHASAAGSFTLSKGSGGSTYFNAAFLGLGEVSQLPWWDDGVAETVGNNTAIEILKAAAIGAGQFHVWYCVVRGGAGGGGTSL